MTLFIRLWATLKSIYIFYKYFNKNALKLIFKIILPSKQTHKLDIRGSFDKSNRNSYFAVFWKKYQSWLLWPFYRLPLDDLKSLKYGLSKAHWRAILSFSSQDLVAYEQWPHSYDLWATFKSTFCINNYFNKNALKLIFQINFTFQGNPQIRNWRPLKNIQQKIFFSSSRRASVNVNAFLKNINPGY